MSYLVVNTLTKVITRHDTLKDIAEYYNVSEEELTRHMTYSPLVLFKKKYRIIETDNTYDITYKDIMREPYRWRYTGSSRV